MEGHSEPLGKLRRGYSWLVLAHLTSMDSNTLKWRR
jgi:hypothetical protein